MCDDDDDDGVKCSIMIYIWIRITIKTSNLLSRRMGRVFSKRYEK